MTLAYSSPHKPGDIIRISNAQKEGNEIVIATAGGLEVHFNLTVGNTATVVVGTESLTIDMRSYCETLVGIPSRET